MPRVTMKNMHLPLPEVTYTRLRAEARRTGRPATDLAREAIDRWLTDVHRQQVHEAIAAYVTEVGGTEDDLDPALEAASADAMMELDDPDGQSL